jgi:hypothetical protein
MWIELIFTPKIFNTVGLLFDLVGAWFVAYEVINKFKGIEYDPIPTLIGESPPPQKSIAYHMWEIRRNKLMLFGLFCLTLGFILQIIANWI